MSRSRLPCLRRSRDDGSAVVEYVLVVAILIPLFLGLLQLGLVLHIRNTLVAAAADGARYGAVSDRGPQDAAARTSFVIKQSLADRFADDVTSGREVEQGVDTVYVEVSTDLPLVGWFLGKPHGITVRAHAMTEQA